MSRHHELLDHKLTRAKTAASEPDVLARLREIVGAENVLVDAERVEPYAGDALKEKFPPEAVVLPATAEEVSQILRLANERLFPVTARGGGVGYTGGAVPVDGGIVVGTDRMNKIREINADDLYVVTEPGVTTYALQQAVEQHGLFYPPDPASYKDSFIGGNIAENAGGIRSAKYGVTKHYVLGLEVVLPTGEIARTGGRVTKNVVGFDLTGLICGSEGMLGIITEATLKLLPLPAATQTVRATFRTMREACACVPRFNRAKVVPVAIEVLDRNSIEAVESEFAFGFGKEAGALLLVSVDGHVEDVERDAKIVEQVVRDGGGFDVVRSHTREEEEKLWDVRRALSPAIKKFGTMKFNEDVVVPRSRVPELIERVDEIARRHKTFVVNFGHAGDGNIHVNFMCDREDLDAMRRAREAVRETFAASVELGGTISGEHGIGYVKAPYLSMALDAASIEMMKRIKRALDPNGILNPGKMFANYQSCVTPSQLNMSPASYSRMEHTDNIKINVAEILSFYDENREVRRHSNAIKTLAGEELGFALLIEYFRRKGVAATLLPRACTTGKSKGPRLDGWIEAKGDSSEPTYYQVEVKSWSIHGVGGDSKQLPLRVTADELAAYKKRLWGQYWSNGRFTEPTLNKVLTWMKREPEWKLVEPLACVWSAMHPQGMSDEFFSVPLISPSVFQRVWVFSMSSFLRNIVQSDPQLELYLPSTAMRINWLQTLFKFGVDAQRE